MRNKELLKRLLGYGALYFICTAVGVYFAYKILWAFERGKTPLWWEIVGVVLGGGGVTASGAPFFAAWREAARGDGPIGG